MRVHHHHHRQPWAQRPLVSDAIVTIAAHRCLSRAAWLNSMRVPLQLIPRWHDQADIKQMYSKYACTTCALIAWCFLDVCFMFASCRLCFMHAYVCLMFPRRLLDVCSMFARCLLDNCLMFAWSCKRGINGVSFPPTASAGCTSVTDAHAETC